MLAALLRQDLSHPCAFGQRGSPLLVEAGCQRLYSHLHRQKRPSADMQRALHQQTVSESFPTISNTFVATQIDHLAAQNHHLAILLTESAFKI